jgi:hypothetical protein
MAKIGEIVSFILFESYYVVYICKSYKNYALILLQSNLLLFFACFYVGMLGGNFLVNDYLLNV